MSYTASVCEYIHQSVCVCFRLIYLKVSCRYISFLPTFQHVSLKYKVILTHHVIIMPSTEFNSDSVMLFNMRLVCLSPHLSLTCPVWMFCFPVPGWGKDHTWLSCHVGLCDISWVSNLKRLLAIFFFLWPLMFLKTSGQFVGLSHNLDFSWTFSLWLYSG